MTTTTQDLIAFLSNLPRGKIKVAGSLSGGGVFPAKKIVCVRDRDDGELWLVVNPAGSHLTTEFYDDHEEIAVFQP